MTAQPEFLDGRVEIVISDNASQDNTPGVCAEYSKKYPNIHYYRNARNVVDQNFPLVLSKANGILRKLHNDTYIFDQGILAILCNLVEEYKNIRPLIFFTDANKTNIVSGIIPFRDFIVQTGYMVTWIGGFSIWEDECGGIEKDTDACRLRLWQVYKAYELGYKKNACVIYNGRMGETQQIKNKDMSYGIYKVFYQNYLSLLRPYVDKKVLTLAEYEIVRKDLLYNFLTTKILDWELQRKEIQYSEEDFKKAVFDEYRNTPYWNEYELFYNKKLVKRKFKLFFRNIFGRK